MPKPAVISPSLPRPPIIQVKDFRAAYGGKTVIQNLNFEILAGEVFVIAGGSGCGKSTMLKHMIGLCAPAGGAILIEGDNPHPSMGDKRQSILRKFGVAFQGGALFGNMPVLQNIRLPMEEFTDLSPAMMDMIALTKLRLVNLEQAA